MNNRSCFILNDDSTAAFSSDPSTFFGTANKYHSLVWCGTYTFDAGSGVIAVFEASNSERHVIRYSLSAGEESIQSIDSHVLPSASGELLVRHQDGSIVAFAGDTQLFIAFYDKTSAVSLENLFVFSKKLSWMFSY